MGWADVWGAVSHADVPAAGVEVAVVVPAEEDAVVGVGGAAVGVVSDVVDFAPCGGDGAAGDDAAAVAERDRAALVSVEDAFFVADADDAAGFGGRDALDHARAPGVAGGGEGNGSVVDLCPSVAGRER